MVTLLSCYDMLRLLFNTTAEWGSSLMSCRVSATSTERLGVLKSKLHFFQDLRRVLQNQSNSTCKKWGEFTEQLKSELVVEQFQTLCKYTNLQVGCPKRSRPNSCMHVEFHWF